MKPIDPSPFERLSSPLVGRSVRLVPLFLRIGASHEGILRCHKRRPDGSLRDTAFFSSIFHHEWPEVKACLQERLAR